MTELETMTQILTRAGIKFNTDDSAIHTKFDTVVIKVVTESSMIEFYFNTYFGELEEIISVEVKQ